jgi:AcrR family transcriptional regulator
MKKKANAKKTNPVEAAKGTRELILDAAIDLFSQKGYDAVSIRDLARSVGIRESSIYNHFKGKEDVMDSIINFFIDELSKYDPNEVPMEVLMEKYGPEGFMDVAGRAYMERIRAPRMEKIWRLISIELYRNKRIRDFFKTTMIEVPLQAWEQTFRKMIDLGYIREYDTRLLAREFFNYCLYLYFEYFFLNYDESEYETFVDSIMDNLSDHIRFMFEKVKVEGAS